MIPPFWLVERKDDEVLEATKVELEATKVELAEMVAEDIERLGEQEGGW